jgi:hypothetical protein
MHSLGQDESNQWPASVLKKREDWQGRLVQIEADQRHLA